MIPRVQLLALCLLPLVSVCRADDGQGRAATVWSPSDLPSGRTTGQLRRQSHLLTKDRSDGASEEPGERSVASPGHHDRKSGFDTKILVQKKLGLSTLSGGGKRSLSAQSGGGKRSLSAQSGGGKRSLSAQSGGGKRSLSAQSGGGKRSPSAQSGGGKRSLSAQSGGGKRSLSAQSGGGKRSPSAQSGGGKRSLSASLKSFWLKLKGASGAVRRSARLAAGAHQSSPSSRSSRAASRRDGSGYIPPDINALIRSSFSRGGLRRSPPGSFVAHLPQNVGRNRPYLVRLPAGHSSVLPTRKRKRVVLIVPVKGGGSTPRRPVVVPVIRDADGPRQPALVPVLRGAGGAQPVAVPAVRAVEEHQPAVVQVIRDAEGVYRPPGDRPPLQRHQVVNPQTVYTLDNPQFRSSGIKGYGPPKLKDVISCTELGVSDCYL